MYRVINEYLEKIKLNTDDKIYSLLSASLSNHKDVEKITVTVNFNRYIVDIKLKKYSVDNARVVFNDFCADISYPYSSLHVRFNEGSCVRYRYVTCKEDKAGFYCDIVIS